MSNGFWQMYQQVIFFDFLLLKVVFIETSFLFYQATVTLSKPLSNDDFILGNTRVSGFYRVNYEDDNWDKIIKQLQTKKDV